MTPEMVFGRPGSASAQFALVLSLFAFVGALFKWVVPGLSDAQHSQKVPQASVTLLGRLSGIRVLALSQGVDYEFLHELGGRRYLILPAAPEATTSDDSGSFDSPDPGEADAPRLTGQLPEGTRFATQGDSARTGRPIAADRLAGMSAQAELQKVAWGEPIRFTADGRAMDAVVTISDDSANERRILVRGSNGTVRLSGR